MSSTPRVEGVERRSVPPRVVGRIDGRPGGPLLIVTVALHGNELASVIAAERVLERARALGEQPAGTIVVIAGNREAMARGVRFIDEDLNRAWDRDESSRKQSTEAAEMREILATIEPLLCERRERVVLIDLHTFSGPGPPFVTVGDSLRNRALASLFPWTLILGLEEQVDGALLEFMGSAGMITMGAEAGQHTDAAAVDRHEALLIVALTKLGIVKTWPAEEVESAERVLEAAGRGLPRVVEIRHRHAVRNGDGFRMEPGFRNLQEIARGQLLAHDHEGPIRAPEDGFILLPLYQGQGEDGFFVARRVRYFWLKVSAMLRRLRVDRFASALPGVRRADGHSDVLVVNLRVARFFPLEVFHLLGYRKSRSEGDELIVSKRPYDMKGPEKITLRPSVATQGDVEGRRRRRSGADPGGLARP